MDLSRRSTRALVYAGGWAAAVVALRLWMYWYYPLLGHDYGALLPAMYELRDAFVRFGRVDVDFSPFRCLGLPVFSHPNALVWSWFHLTALAFGELGGLFAAAVVFMTFGYVGGLALARRVGCRPDVAVLLAVGWCLQGFCVSHALAGHLNYLQFVLLPLFLLVLADARASWAAIAAVAFWMAHFVYTGGYYLLAIGVPSVLTAAGFLAWLVPALLAAGGLGGTATVLRNLVRATPLAAAMCAPKVLGVLNFTALFPRLTHLDRIELWRALVYTTSQYVYPLPYDVHRFARWSYGNWESYEFMLPGVTFWLAWLLWRARADVPWRRFATCFALLIAVGTVLSAGILAPVFEALPLLKSLHVNPRWNAFVLLPFFALALAAAAAVESCRSPLSAGQLAALAAILFTVPLAFVDKVDMQITYPDRNGIDLARHRVLFCYEPLFGYRLEQFPLGADVDWASHPLVDARCYLASTRCRPGSPFGDAAVDTADYAALTTYALRDVYAPVAYGKWLALCAYLVGAAAAVTWLARTTSRLLASVDPVAEPCARPRAGPR